MTFLAWLMVAVGAIAQATTGFGFSLVSAPFLIAAYGAPLGVQLNLVLAVAINIGLLVPRARTADVHHALVLLVPAALATVAVGAAIRNVDHGPLTIVAGIVCLAGTAALASGTTFRRLEGRVATAAVGAASGAMNVTAGIGGPPIALFAVNAGWSPEIARPTMQLFFLGINAVALTTLGMPDELPLGSVAAVAIGLLVGRLALQRVPDGGIKRLTLALAAIGSVLAILRDL
jgi:uncharacterized membrane protein YfcA